MDGGRAEDTALFLGGVLTLPVLIVVQHRFLPPRGRGSGSFARCTPNIDGFSHVSGAATYPWRALPCPASFTVPRTLQRWRGL